MAHLGTPELEIQAMFDSLNQFVLFCVISIVNTIVVQYISRIEYLQFFKDRISDLSQPAKRRWIILSTFFSVRMVKKTL